MRIVTSARWHSRETALASIAGTGKSISLVSAFFGEVHRARRDFGEPAMKRSIYDRESDLRNVSERASLMGRAGPTSPRGLDAILPQCSAGFCDMCGIEGYRIKEIVCAS